MSCKPMTKKEIAQKKCEMIIRNDYILRLKDLFFNLLIIKLNKKVQELFVEEDSLEIDAFRKELNKKGKAQVEKFQKIQKDYLTKTKKEEIEKELEEWKQKILKETLEKG